MSRGGLCSGVDVCDVRRCIVAHHLHNQPTNRRNVVDPRGLAAQYRQCCHDVRAQFNVYHACRGLAHGLLAIVTVYTIPTVEQQVLSRDPILQPKHLFKLLYQNIKPHQS